MSILKRFSIIVIAFSLCLWTYTSKPFNLGLDLKGGISIIIEAQEIEGRQITSDDMTGVMDVIRGRINALGLTEPIIQKKGLDQVIIEIPGIKDTDRAIALIGETAQLTFHKAEWAPQNVDKLSPDKLELLVGKNANLGYLDQILSNGEILKNYIHEFAPYEIKDQQVSINPNTAVGNNKDIFYTNNRQPF